MKLDMKSLPEKLSDIFHKVGRYRIFLFFLLLAAVYGFLFYRIGALNNAEPDPASLTAQNQTAQVPRIDPDVVKQLQQLQDNSVNVQTLFDQARSNPFQE
jgi:hypothetical protein